MNITFSPELVRLLQKRGHHSIIVEVVSSSSSDFDVTELHIFTADDKKAAFYVESKKYRRVEVPGGCVLLPQYRLTYDEEILFDVKKILFIQTVACKGIRL